MNHPFIVNISSIRRTPGARQEVDRQGHIDELRVSSSAVPTDAVVTFAGVLEAVDGPAIVADGVVSAPWKGECRRCLGEAAGMIEESVREIFEPESTFTEGETYPINGDTVDLEPLVRESIILELPKVPLCREDCAGLCPNCGINRNEATCNCKATPTDPRWAVLDLLQESSD